VKKLGREHSRDDLRNLRHASMVVAVRGDSRRAAEGAPRRDDAITTRVSYPANTSLRRRSGGRFRTR
jgi:hypothetical protein